MAGAQPGEHDPGGNEYCGVELISGVYGIPADVVQKILDAGIDVNDDEAWQLAENLQSAFPNLSADDIARLVLAIMTGGLSLVAVIGILSQLCGGLPGIADTVVNALNDPNSDDATLLNKILDTARKARSGIIGDQRVMAVLKLLGVDNIQDISMNIPGSDADIVTRDGIGIEVGGPAKGGDTFDTQLQKYIARFGKDKVDVYLEDDGRPEVQEAIAAAKKKLQDPNDVHPFSPDDRMCTN